MSSEHAKFHFNVTCHTHDEAVLHCLRALAAYAQKKGNKYKTWGGSGKKEWERDGHQVTFRFTKREYRDAFEQETQRLLPKDCWGVASRSDAGASPRCSTC